MGSYPNWSPYDKYKLNLDMKLLMNSPICLNGVVKNDGTDDSIMVILFMILLDKRLNLVILSSRLVVFMPYILILSIFFLIFYLPNGLIIFVTL